MVVGEDAPTVEGNVAEQSAPFLLLRHDIERTHKRKLEKETQLILALDPIYLIHDTRQRPLIHCLNWASFWGSFLWVYETFLFCSYFKFPNRNFFPAQNPSSNPNVWAPNLPFISSL